MEITVDTLKEILDNEIDIERGNATVDSESTPDADKLWEKILDFQPKHWWICFQSKVMDSTKGLPLARDDDKGVPLYGELCNGDTSLHFKRVGKEWMVSEIGRGGDGEDCLIIKEEYLSVDKGSGKLCYEIFWKESADLKCFAPYTSRFTGFKEGK